MALTSPGVEVSVIDESFYTPAEPGTTPLIIVATAQDKNKCRRHWRCFSNYGGECRECI